MFTGINVIVSSQRELIWEVGFWMKVGVARVADGGKPVSNHNYLQVSQFKEAKWPDSLCKYLRAVEKKKDYSRAVLFRWRMNQV